MKSMFDREYIWGLANMGKRMGVSYVEAWRRIKDGRLPAERAGHQWVARASDLDAFRATNPPEISRRHKPKAKAASSC